jgi:hypothetical protein
MVWIRGLRRVVQEFRTSPQPAEYVARDVCGERAVAGRVRKRQAATSGMTISVRNAQTRRFVASVGTNPTVVCSRSATATSKLLSLRLRSDRGPTLAAELAWPGSDRGHPQGIQARFLPQDELAVQQAVRGLA